MEILLDSEPSMIRRLSSGKPYASLPFDVDVETLGSAALNALGSSGRTVPHPASWNGLGAARLAAAGVRSEKAFHLGARGIGVERLANLLRLEPTRNGGTKGDAKGFEPLPGLALSKVRMSGPNLS